MSKPDVEINGTSIPSPDYDISGYTSVIMERWHYYVDRGKLTIVKGLIDSEKKSVIIEECEKADSGIPTEDCPEHFTILAKPLDLVRFARQILAFYKGYEDVL